MHEAPGRGGADRLRQCSPGSLDNSAPGSEDDVSLSLGQLGQPLTEGREPLDGLACVDPDDDRFDPSLVLPDVDPVAVVRAPDAQLVAPGRCARQEGVQRLPPAPRRLAYPPGIAVTGTGGSGYEMQIELPACHLDASPPGHGHRHHHREQEDGRHPSRPPPAAPTSRRMAVRDQDAGVAARG